MFFIKVSFCYGTPTTNNSNNNNYFANPINHHNYSTYVLRPCFQIISVSRNITRRSHSSSHISHPLFLSFTFTFAFDYSHRHPLHPPVIHIPSTFTCSSLAILTVTLIACHQSRHITYPIIQADMRKEIFFNDHHVPINLPCLVFLTLATGRWRRNICLLFCFKILLHCFVLDVASCIFLCFSLTPTFFPSPPTFIKPLSASLPPTPLLQIIHHHSFSLFFFLVCTLTVILCH